MEMWNNGMVEYSIGGSKYLGQRDHEHTHD